MMEITEGFGLPDGMGREDQWTWFHCSPGEKLGLLILSEKPYGYAGHYVRGRMRNCAGEGCKTCERGIGKQARYVMSACRIRDGKIGILEVGRPAALMIRELAQGRGRLRGLAIQLEREGVSKHSRIEVAVFEGIVPKPFESFPALDVPRVLELTWATALSGSRD